METSEHDDAASNVAIGSSQKKWAICLTIAQVAAAIVAVSAAYYQTESIIVTLPTMAVAGFALAFVTRRWRSWLLLAFSLSAPLAAGLGSIIIWIFTIGPDDARRPMCYLTMFYAAVASSASFFVYRRIASSLPAAAPVRRAWQFSMKSLMIVMTVICIVLTMTPFLFPKDSGNHPHADLAPFVIFSFVVFSLAIWFVIDFFKARGKVRKNATEDLT